jgi:fructokinase
MSTPTTTLFGEVLFDCFQDGKKILGGAPFNVAWNLQAFGANPLFISRIGNDPKGEEILEAMRSWGMTTEGVQVDPREDTGMVRVRMSDGEPEYTIVYPAAYDFIEPASVSGLNECRLLYHGTLALRNFVSRRTLEDLRRRMRGQVFVDVNLRKPWWDRDLTRSVLKQASYIKLNSPELNLLTPRINEEKGKISHLQAAYGPKQIILTRGKHGAAIFLAGHVRHEYVPHQQPHIVDPVGAGDAFSSVMLLGLLKNWAPSLTLSRAGTFAEAVLGLRGATTQDKKFYQFFLKSWES